VVFHARGKFAAAQGPRLRPARPLKVATLKRRLLMVIVPPPRRYVEAAAIARTAVSKPQFFGRS
jgi:hypothetical protein